MLTVPLASACSGGTFNVGLDLAATRMMPVTGTLGVDSRNCETGSVPVESDAPVTVGSLTGIAGAPHRTLSTTETFFEAALRDYQRLLKSLGPQEPAGRVSDALAKLSGSDSSVSAQAQDDDLLRGLEFVLALPKSATETTTFPFLASRDERAIMGACSTTDTTPSFVFDDPQFSMTCRLASEADGVPHVLRVHAFGKWANYRFEGELAAENGERAAFKSQNMSVAGAGTVRGFELLMGSRQIGAVSFWQVPERTTEFSKEPRYLPGAWLLPSHRNGWGDAVAATLAIAYAYPWPDACDANRSRQSRVDEKATLADRAL